MAHLFRELKNGRYNWEEGVALTHGKNRLAGALAQLGSWLNVPQCVLDKWVALVFMGEGGYGEPGIFHMSLPA